MRKVGAVLVSLFLAIAPLSAFARALPCTSSATSVLAYGFNTGTCGGWETGQIGDTVILSGFTGDYAADNATYTITNVGGIGNGIITTSPAPAYVGSGGNNESGVTYSAPAAAPAIDFGWTNGGGAAATVTGIRDIVGQNFSGLAVIAGLIIGVPLSFYVIERIMGWFAYRKLTREHTEAVIEGLGADNVFIGGKSVRDIRESGG